MMILLEFGTFATIIKYDPSILIHHFRFSDIPVLIVASERRVSRNDDELG